MPVLALTPPWSATALGLALGAGLDLVVADPRRGHPVAGFGRAACALERRVWADRHGPGVLLVLAGVGGCALLGTSVQRACATPSARAGAVAAATWAVLGGTSLAREAAAMSGLLQRRDVGAARARLASLCGRDPDTLDADGLARATVESVAENTCDAVVAPLLWGAVAGIPGLLGYRAANTLDAMVGHRSPRYSRFGWAAARLDDAANLVPARVTGLLAAALAPLVDGSPRQALTALRRDGGAHPSPNAGPCEAAFAGALGVTLGGTTVYGGRVEQRGPLGNGPSPAIGDVARAVRLSRAVGFAALALAVGVRAGMATSAARAATPSRGPRRSAR